VLYLGALGDRYGRKLMLVLGVSLSVPACILAALAPTDTVLFIARLLGGLSAGMAYPTTLALITALWSGPGRTRAIALWSALGGAISSLGPLIAGFLLQHFYWGSVFLVTLPLAAVALVCAVVFVPAHINEGTDPVDNLGGILSVLLIAGVVLAINFAAVPDAGTVALGLAGIALASGIGFVVRQRRARFPLYDLHVAGRRIFWVAALAGIIVFGSLMGRCSSASSSSRTCSATTPWPPVPPSCRPRCAWSSSLPVRPGWSRPGAPGSPCCSATSSACWGS
jgi:DHA2 family multidrug resistance protein-like MFS transporter